MVYDITHTHIVSNHQLKYVVANFLQAFMVQVIPRTHAAFTVQPLESATSYAP